MRFSTFSAIAAFAATTLAQDVADIPACAAQCVGDGLASTGCNVIDVACICGSASWIGELSCCVSQVCDEASQASVIRFANQICQPVGVTNLPTVAACTGTFTPTGTQASATGSSTAGSLESAASSASGAVSSGLASISSAASSAASAASAATSSGKGAAAPTAFALPMGVAAAAGLFAAAL